MEIIASSAKSFVFKRQGKCYRIATHIIDKEACVEEFLRTADASVFPDESNCDQVRLVAIQPAADKEVVVAALADKVVLVDGDEVVQICDGLDVSKARKILANEAKIFLQMPDHIIVV